MSKLLTVIFLLGVASTATAQGYPQPPPPPPQAPANVHYGWAEVLRVDPVYAPVSQRQAEQCYPQATARDDRAGGTVLGAIVGGVLGSTVGKGDGRKAATVAGAIAGGAIGNRVAAANDNASQQTVCRPVDHYAPQQQIVAYDVEYRYRGDVYMSRLPYDPGERMRVRIAITPAD